jgi:peptide/nickel transport system substrate-binding protein
VAEREGTLGPIATLIQASFKSLGLNLQLNPLPQAQFADRVFAKHDVPMFLDDQDKPDLVTGEYALGPCMTTTGPGNYTKYSNPDIDRLVAQIYDETDSAKQQQLLNQAQEILMQAPNWIPIAGYETQWGLRSNATGITWHPRGPAALVRPQADWLRRQVLGVSRARVRASAHPARARSAAAVRMTGAGCNRSGKRRAL